MPNSFGRSITKRVIAAALLSGACVAPASAADAYIKEIKFEIVAPWKSEINVSSSDGSRWDTILPDPLTLWVHMVVDTRWRGYVEAVKVHLGHCNGSLCPWFPTMFYELVMERDYRRQTNIHFSPAGIPVSAGNGIPVVRYGDEILAACNAKLQPDGATKPHSFDKTMTATFGAGTGKATFKKNFVEESGSDNYDPDYTRHAQFTVKVNCLATSKTTEPPPQRHNVKVEDIKLFLTTYGGQASAGRTPGVSSCKPLKVTTRIETDKEGPVKVKLWRKIDNGPTTDEIRTLDAKALGGDKFGADWDKWEHFGKTTYAQYMAEIIGGTFAPSTPWKDITIQCGGNFADAPRGGAGPINPDPTRPGVVADPPKLSCAGGVVKNNDCICPRGNKEVQVGANAYRCVANEPSGPKISCAGGTLKGNDCVCPRGTKEVKVGANAYRCVQSVAQPTPTKAKALAVQRTPVVPPRRMTGTTTGVRVR